MTKDIHTFDVFVGCLALKVFIYYRVYITLYILQFIYYSLYITVYILQFIYYSLYITVYILQFRGKTKGASFVQKAYC